MADRVPVVTIDGPAATGKTSVSRELADRLGWKWVSTGAFYRGLAYAALKKNIRLDDEQGLVELAGSSIWQVQMAKDSTAVVFNEINVTDEIYQEEIGSFASQVSQYSGVRTALLAPQRDCAKSVKGLVAEGRDCGTVIFPEAEVKIFLKAGDEARARRRVAQLGGDVEKIQSSQAQRDRQDSQRKVAPLKPAQDAHHIDTSQMNLQQVVDHVEAIVRKSIRGC